MMLLTFVDHGPHLTPQILALDPPAGVQSPRQNCQWRATLQSLRFQIVPWKPMDARGCPWMMTIWTWSSCVQQTRVAEPHTVSYSYWSLGGRQFEASNVLGCLVHDDIKSGWGIFISIQVVMVPPVTPGNGGRVSVQWPASAPRFMFRIRLDQVDHPDFGRDTWSKSISGVQCSRGRRCEHWYILYIYNRF